MSEFDNLPKEQEKPQPATIYLIRHAESHGNINFGAVRNPGLTPTGEQQALGLVEELKDIPVSAIYSSPSARAVSAAEFFAKERVLPIRTYEELKEKIKKD